MVNEHTAGPWDAEQLGDDEWGVYFEHGQAILVVGLDEADARLIAAAPDLLAALVRAVNDMEEMAYSVVTLAGAREAIAKATGEASR